MLPSQGLPNRSTKLGVGLDPVRHSGITVDDWLSGGGCFGADFWGSLRERGLVPVFGTGMDDVRAALRRPSRVETQGPRTDFELANSRSFLAQMVTQSATIVARFTFEVLAYVASKKDFEIHDLALSFGCKGRRVLSIAPVVSLPDLSLRAN